jgi:hypothetical protein
MRLEFSAKIRQKLTAKSPPVSENDVWECFANRSHGFLIDTRENHLTDPVTQWFISENDYGCRLKVCFMHYPDKVSIKTAYVPNSDEERIYKKLAVPL